ncbi:MAG: amidohydrolase family protein, partial [Oligoflexus sp.]|nr:amidohydrolase family protein [Oligoflexus sp.]
EKSKGALSVGHDADFVIHDLDTLEQWIADFGQTDPIHVYCSGQRV